MRREKFTASVAALPAMTTAQLRSEWQQVLGSAAPAGFGKEMLTRGIAYRLQEQVHGGLVAATARQLAEAMKQVARGKEPSPSATLREGTHLVRDWHGRTHHVLVLDDGYLFKDRQYHSLSAIARDITGARWSGPRFFGLNRNEELEREAA